MLAYFKEKIDATSNKMITYADYMADALYHPQWGYYMKQGEKVGRKGDFITTSNVSDIYGRLMAKWFIKLRKELNLPPNICEIGAGNGRFAAAFIDEWKKNSTLPLHYHIVEESPYHRELQKDNITFDNTIKQVDSLESIKPFKGFIFSNELFDALPVHVIERKAGKLLEVMVSYEQNELVEKFVPVENEDIVRFLEESQLKIKDNQRIEIPLAMAGMLRRISNVLEQGMMVTVDYGYSNKEWMEPIHRDGSLRGYYKHELMNNVLENPGHMDITSHVHFDSFIKYGEQHGLNFVKQQRQDEFLMSIGILKELEDHYDPNPFSEISRRNRSIRSLILPSGMSSYFQVVIQKKGIPNIECI
jgi:SAM-dependent MidA family methyltransferase